MAIFKAGAKYSGKAVVGPSKSHVIRLLFCAMLSGIKTTVFFRGTLCDDILAMISAVSDVGASVCYDEEKIIVSRTGALNKTATVNLKECGTGFAFFSVLNCFPGWNLTLKRERSLLSRDFSGAKVDFDANGNVIVSGEKSSQPVSAAIICAALEGHQKREVFVRGKICSRGYIEMTSQVVKLFEKNDEISVFAEADGSSLSVLEAASYLGAEIDFEKDNVSLQPDATCSKYFDKDVVDITDNPDLIFTLSVIAASHMGRTVIKNVLRLKNKESDRANGCVKFINALGGNAELIGNNVEVTGNGKLLGGSVCAEGDHRVAFAAFLASLISENDVSCVGAEEAVKKSWPDFIETIRGLEASNA